MLCNDMNFYTGSILKRDLINKFNVKKIDDIPRLKAITLSFSCPKQKLNEVSTSVLALRLITGHKPAILNLCRKTSLGSKYRKGFPSGVSTKLKKKRAFELLFYLITEIIPKAKKKKEVKLPLIKPGHRALTFTIKDLFSFEDLEENLMIFKKTPPITLSIFFHESEDPVKKSFILETLKLKTKIPITKN